ncbi:hypothetical protein DOTSEDRAFT_67816 [Dothistroma septosporum NZE10]|uniref:BZIP domain-containing protein n=1 Tax=Dothistroma septosporum (strain NZE10 / CBS 128990) TaxID=675120 RepID=N1Q0R7_DOTSN|nr:hypothetical protein DOTSEDRAFT_67816 [Dothistroma septosporum NZE10]
MAAQLHQTPQRANPYLSPAQQHLLLAALHSQAQTNQSTASQVKRSDSDPATMNTANGSTLFMSPHSGDLDSFEYTPDLDYLDGGDNFDFENTDLGGDMIGALPGSGAGTEVENDEGHEKRKSPDDHNDEEGGDAKRQETKDGEKGAKKPGRKPLTSEPTTKRKAQNRAAQRAFRERKEAHLKDLETKVTELTKAQEADKHENGLLKAQVDRLQTELKEYRKRLSLNSGISRSPPLTAKNSQHRSNSNPPSYGGNFQFDFPKFGGLPGSQIFGNSGANASNSGILKRDSLTPPQVTQSHTTINGYGQQSQLQSQTQSEAQAPRRNSMARSLSPSSVPNGGAKTGSPSQYFSLNPSFAPYSTNNNMHGFASTLPQMNGGSDGLADLFSPSLLKSASVDGYFDVSQNSNGVSNSSQALTLNGGNDSTSGLNRVFQFNSSSSTSDGTSPSASSQSQWNGNGANSSCGTSPEPSQGSPASNDKAHMPAQKQQSPLSQFTDINNQANTGLNATFGLPNTDYNVPPLGNFDPVLFGDYRESNDAIVGGGDFTGGFFDDALNSAPLDYSSPSNLFGILQSPEQTYDQLPAQHSVIPASQPAPSQALMAEIENARNGGDDDYGLPNTKQQSQSAKKVDSSGKLISCNNIWNQLQSNPDFQEGKFDLDGLCSELRAKARCSESGVMVDQDHVDAALKKLGRKDEKGKAFDVPPLMFEQESWDNVLKKLREGRA